VIRRHWFAYGHNDSRPGPARPPQTHLRNRRWLVLDCRFRRRRGRDELDAALAEFLEQLGDESA
jgi:hypothetical protein